MFDYNPEARQAFQSSMCFQIYRGMVYALQVRDVSVTTPFLLKFKRKFHEM